MPGSRARWAPASAPSRLLVTLLAVLALLFGGLAPAATAARPAATGSPGFCPDGTGVTVVVDFQELGSGRIVRCAHGPQADGLAALKAAGFQINGTNRWGESFICRINGRPGPDTEPCVDTPPTSAYWSYWHAQNGGDWTYSQRGVTYRTPPEGSFEGWSFSMDRDADAAPVPGVAALRPQDGGSSGGSGGGPSGGSGGGSGGGTSSGGGATGDGGSGGAGDSGGGGGTVPPPPAAPADPPDGEAARDDEPAGKDEEEKDDADKKDKDGKDKNEEEDKEEDEEAERAADDNRATPAPTEAADWSGEDTEFEGAAEAGGGSIPTGTAAVLGLVTALLAGAGYTAWRRRRTEQADAGLDETVAGP